MEICGQWLDDDQSIYLIRVRGWWKVQEVDDYLIAFFNTNTTARYVIFDPTDAMLPTELVNPVESWSLEDALALAIKHFFLRPEFQRYVRVVNNDLPYFAISLEYFKALGVHHRIHHVNSLAEAEAFVQTHHHASSAV